MLPNRDALANKPPARTRGAFGKIAGALAVVAVWGANGGVGYQVLQATKPGPPTARCADGSLSYSHHHSGTCSWHGGVRAWVNGSGTIP